MVSPYRLDPWTRRMAVWIRLAPLAEARNRAAVRCEHCGGAICVSNGKLVCGKCGRPG